MYFSIWCKFSLEDTMKDAVIVEAMRTPIGALGGKLASIRPDDLVAHGLVTLCVGVGQGESLLVEWMD